VEDTCPDDIRGFLDHLAVEGKVSASTQRQALNALVFLLREALDRDPGDFSGYRPARQSKRIPVVLSRQECQFSCLMQEDDPRKAHIPFIGVRL
jgi:hypothetical protein